MPLSGSDTARFFAHNIRCDPPRLVARQQLGLNVRFTPESEHWLAHCSLDDEWPRFRYSGAQRGGSFYTINKRFCLRDVIESNESEKLRRTSIKSGYIFCSSEIATVLKLDFYSGSVGRLAESLKAFGIGYLVNLNHNKNRRRGRASV
jgi:hypothetical protein